MVDLSHFAKPSLKMRNFEQELTESQTFFYFKRRQFIVYTTYCVWKQQVGLEF